MVNALRSLTSLASPETGAPWVRRAGFAAALVAVVLLAATAAEVTWRVAAPPETAAVAPAPAARSERAAGADGEAAGEARDGLAEVARFHLFGRPPEGAGGEEGRREVPLDAPKTRLNLTLRGVLAVGGEGRGTAIISGGDGETVYLVGAELPGGAVLEHVYGDRVILLRNDEFEMLMLERDQLDIDGSGSVVRAAAPGESPVRLSPGGRTGSAGGERVAERGGDRRSGAGEEAGERRVARHELEDLRDDLYNNPQRLAEMVNVSPVLSGGSIRGFRVTPQGDGREYFERAGLRSGDVVTAVNDIPVSDTGRLEGLVNQLDSAREVRLRVDRDGTEENLVLRID